MDPVSQTLNSRRPSTCTGRRGTRRIGYTSVPLELYGIRPFSLYSGSSVELRIALVQSVCPRPTSYNWSVGTCDAIVGHSDGQFPTLTRSAPGILPGSTCGNWHFLANVSREKPVRVCAGARSWLPLDPSETQFMIVVSIAISSTTRPRDLKVFVLSSTCTRLHGSSISSVGACSDCPQSCLPFFHSGKLLYLKRLNPSC